MSTNYCDTCQKSDCACIYSICLNHRPLNQTPLSKKTQENKQEKQKLDQLQFVQALGTPQLHRSDKQRIQDNNTELKKNNSTLFLSG